VNGKTRTVRQEDSDQGENCSARSEAEVSMEDKDQPTEP
jgi:hypothetical protein